MDFEVAATLSRRIGRGALIGYAQRVFAVTDEALDALSGLLERKGTATV